MTEQGPVEITPKLASPNPDLESVSTVPKSPITQHELPVPPQERPLPQPEAFFMEGGLNYNPPPVYSLVKELVRRGDAKGLANVLTKINSYMNIRPYVTKSGKEIYLTPGTTIGSFEPSQRKALREDLERFINEVKAYPDDDANTSAHSITPHVEMHTPFGKMFIGYVGQKRWQWNISHTAPGAIKRWAEVQTYPFEEFGYNAWAELLPETELTGKT